ncbi:hypothetical protein ACIP5L_28870 [Streptomyces bacillaris]|uniref:hypothetical protein n=1 Tax=Streptomyces bacillaris TaxID=68179 RepID=UPI0037F137A0
MKRRKLLIALIAVLSLALTAVVTDIATGFITGNGAPAPSAAPQPGGPPGAAPTGVVPEAGTAGDAPVVGETPAAFVAPDEKARYVGTSDDGRFTIAVVVWATRAIAHITDGAADEAWLSGTAGGPALLLTGEGGEAVFHGTVQDGTLTGTASRGHWKAAFTLPEAEAPAGLYRAAGQVGDQRVTLGLIVAPDGSQTGIQWTDGKPRPAPGWDLEGSTVTFGGTELRVEAIAPHDV